MENPHPDPAEGHPLSAGRQQPCPEIQDRIRKDRVLHRSHCSEAAGKQEGSGLRSVLIM